MSGFGSRSTIGNVEVQLILAMRPMHITLYTGVLKVRTVQWEFIPIFCARIAESGLLSGFGSQSTTSNMEVQLMLAIRPMHVALCTAVLRCVQCGWSGLIVRGNLFQYSVPVLQSLDFCPDLAVKVQQAIWKYS